MKRFGLRLVLKVSGFGKVGRSLLERRTVTSSYHQRRRQRERQKSNRFILAKQNTCTCITRTDKQKADLATKRERQLTTARANQTTGLTNGRGANWTPTVEFSPFRALSRRQMTFPFRC